MLKFLNYILSKKIALLFLIFTFSIIYRNYTHLLFDDVILQLCYSGYYSCGIPVSDHMFQHFIRISYILLFTYAQSIRTKLSQCGNDLSFRLVWVDIMPHPRCFGNKECIAGRGFRNNYAIAAANFWYI